MPALLQVRSRSCVTCSQPADSYCSNCGVTPYCSTKCQIKDWNGRHRAVCHNLARIQNPAPLRRPHAVADQRPERSQRRDDDADTRVSDRSNRNDRFSRLQDRTSRHTRSSNNQDRRHPPSKRSQNNFEDEKDEKRNFQQRSSNRKPADAPKAADSGKADAKSVVKFDTDDEWKQVKSEAKSSPEKKSAPISVPKTPQLNGDKQEVPAVKPTSLGEVTTTIKPASLGDVTPTKKMIPKNYLIEQLSIGDTVLLSVDAKASDCKTTVGDYVCLSMHEKFESDYQSLCEDYVLVCDADDQEYKLIPGETCSYFNVEDGGWYRARCLNPTTIALIDGSKILTVASTDKIRKLPTKYEQVPEFCCILESKNVEVGSNLKCVLVSKSSGGYKVSLENVDTGSSVGEGTVTRWVPTVEYPPAKPVIPEVPRPPLAQNSRVLLVDATALDRAFVRPADTQRQVDYDDVVQNALLAGRKATPLKEPPVKGQTVIAKFTDGLHYRALCKRTHIAQNKYLLEYIDYGNIEVCRNLEDLFPCPPHLDLAAAPTQVSMIKLSSAGGAFTPPAAEYVEKLKDSNDEMILSLTSGEQSAPSGSEVILKLAKNSENVNKKIIEMCTPDWKKFQEKGGDVVDIEPLMYWDLEYQDLPSGPVDLDILDHSILQGGMISGCVKGDPHAEYVFSQVTKKMADYCNSEIGQEPYLPKVEELCIAQCPPYTQWFRAVLLEQIEGAGGSMARVCYVDYGNVELVPVTLLRKMLPEFVHGLPVVGSHFEIEDFPPEPTLEMVSRAVEHLRVDEAGRGVLRARALRRLEAGLYSLQAPELLAAMTR